MLVLDCSVALAWLLPDESSAYADAAMAALKEEGAMVPPLWIQEVANVLLVAIRRGRIAQDAALEFAEQMNFIGLRLSDQKPEIDHLPWLIEFGAEHGLTAYDASYLLLAIEQDAKLATLDKRLAAVAGVLGLLWQSE
ncbi:MAG: type II toxin-antitoxin system VapC family toxin [Thiothrix sp.]|nr:type II toxin-antitoxin system VapC family toxin [Thiothrix sp.]